MQQISENSPNSREGGKDQHKGTEPGNAEKQRWQRKHSASRHNGGAVLRKHNIFPGLKKKKKKKHIKR